VNLNINGMLLECKEALDKKFFDIITVVFFSVMFLLIIHNPFRISHDCAGILQTTQMIILDGKRPYTDIELINPPLIFYLNSIPVLIAHFFSVSIISVFSLLVFGLTIWSTLTIRHLLSRLPSRFTKMQAGFICLSLVVFGLFLWRQENFGQREHLFILMYLPFFILRWIRWEGGFINMRHAIALGTIGAIGVCIKPYFVVISLAPEIYWCFSKRNVRNFIKPEMLAFIGSGLIYAVHFVFLPADIKEAFFGSTLPFVLKGYHAYNNPMIALFQWRVIYILLAITLLPFFIHYIIAESDEWNITRPLAFMTMASFGIYLIQHKGWGYHLIPFCYGSLMISSVIVVLIQPRLFVVKNDRIPDRVFRVPITKYQICLIVLGLLFYWDLKIMIARTVPLSNNPIISAISQYSEENEAIEFISTSVTPGAQILLQLNRRRASRYGNHFVLPFIRVIWEEEPLLAAKEEERYLNNLTHDILTSRPRLIFVANGSNNQGMPVDFNFLQYLVKIGFIDRSMKDYEYLTEAYDFAVYRLKDYDTGL